MSLTKNSANFEKHFEQVNSENEFGFLSPELTPQEEMMFKKHEEEKVVRLALAGQYDIPGENHMASAMFFSPDYPEKVNNFFRSLK